MFTLNADKIDLVRRAALAHAMRSIDDEINESLKNIEILTTTRFGLGQVVQPLGDCDPVMIIGVEQGNHGIRYLVTSNGVNGYYLRDQKLVEMDSKQPIPTKLESYNLFLCQGGNLTIKGYKYNINEERQGSLSFAVKRVTSTERKDSHYECCVLLEPTSAPAFHQAIESGLAPIIDSKNPKRWIGENGNKLMQDILNITDVEELKKRRSNIELNAANPSMAIRFVDLCENNIIKAIVEVPIMQHDALIQLLKRGNIQFSLRTVDLGDGPVPVTYDYYLTGSI